MDDPLRRRLDSILLLAFGNFCVLLALAARDAPGVAVGVVVTLGLVGYGTVRQW